MKEFKGEVNFWKSGLHGEEIGIRQKEVWMAKTRQFTKDMDIYGSVSKEDKKVGFVAYREKVWNKLGRLVVRMFSDSGSWMGSIEEMVGEELRRSLYAEEPTPVFVVSLPNYKYITFLERIYKPKTFQRETYSFKTIDKDGKVNIYSVIGARFSIGRDFKLLRENDDKEVGKIDSKVMDIGGKVELKIKDEIMVKDSVAISTLFLFSSCMKFMDEIKERIEDMMKKLKKDKEYVIKLSRGELSYYRNPRRLFR
ncbi:MAG: hypothetical protein ACTSR0_00925 [Candidatus Asgardarchaeia archaeon]